MVKAWNWQDTTATTKDQDGDEHESSVTYAVVTEDQSGYEVNTLTGVVRVNSGDVLVQNPGDNQGRVDVLPKDVWESSGYASNNTSQDEANPAGKEAPKPSVGRR